MDRLVNVERAGSAAILTIIHPPVNALSRDVANAIREAWLTLDADRIVITGTGKIFVAGADIREIERIAKGEAPPDLRYLHELLASIERSGQLVVMAMNGIALGIGLELAMAGHYRILDSRAQIGLPEVKLGLMPGAGGTQRLPRLAGIENALRMCVSGESIDAQTALEFGIVDELCEGNVVARALKIETGKRTDLLRCHGAADWDRWRAGCPPRQHSPVRAIAAIEAAASSAVFDDGLAVEQELFEQALIDPQARAMVHLFFAERESAKVDAIGKQVSPAAIEKVVVIEDEIEIEAGGTCRLRPSPAELGGRIVEVRHQEHVAPETLAAALLYVRKQGKLPIVVYGDRWVGRVDLDGAAGTSLLADGAVARAGDIDVLMVRGYGYLEELGGPMHVYSTTPSQTSESLREPLK